MKPLHGCRCKRAEQVTLIKTVTLVGSGTEEDLFRDVEQYWTLDGKLVATVDPVEEEKREEERRRAMEEEESRLAKLGRIQYL